MISNCGHDERGQYHGGKPGDQTGTEWELRPWYNRPWDCVIRYNGPKKEEVRRLIGNFAIQCAKNDNIGYNQDYPARYTFWKCLMEVSQPKYIDKKCDTDCSAANLAIVDKVLKLLDLGSVDHTGYTGNMREILSKVGFEILYDSRYLTGESYLVFGDILLNIKNHTATYVGDGKEQGGDTPEGFTYARNDIKAFQNSKSVKELKTCLSLLGYYDRNKGFTEEYNQYTYDCIYHFQEVNGDSNPDGNAITKGWTWAKADSLVGNRHTYIEYGMTGKSVYIMQCSLNKLGYTDANGNKLEEDGEYGPRTFEAICKLQEEFDFGADGIANPNGWTWNKVDELLAKPKTWRVKVNTPSGINVRKEPSESSARIGGVYNGEVYTASKEQNGFTFIVEKGGWCKSQYLVVI